jgi:2'-5' RNA ligase
VEQIRAFIAIELPREIKQELMNIQSRLESKSRAPAKWVEPGSIHLTLKFLGNIDTEIIPKINTTLEKAAAGILPFSLELDGLGVFPGQSRVRVVWVGLAGDLDRLSRLQQRVESDLVLLGFSTEGRGFSPHLTLARVRENATPAERQELGRLISETKLDPGARLEVRAIHLIKSHLTRTGPIYTPINTVELK